MLRGTGALASALGTGLILICGCARSSLALTPDEGASASTVRSRSIEGDSVRDSVLNVDEGEGRQDGGVLAVGVHHANPVDPLTARTAQSCVGVCAHADGVPTYEPRTRTYYIAAEELEWDYAPDRRNVVMGKPFGEEEDVFVKGNGITRIGARYRKALYREYTDGSFETPKTRPDEDQYLGIVGPVIHGVVGDTIKVVFHNAGTRPYSVHAHGVFYDKASEGAETADNTGDQDRLDDMVDPGQSYTYTWRAVERSGPGPADLSSVVWLYHSHISDGIADEYAGLFGTIVISDAAHGTESGVPSDVDREITTLFMVDDENQSLFFEENIMRYAPGAHRDDPEFEESNLMHMINGYVYGNGPRLSVRERSRVRWYLLTLGTEVDLHTPHWHGATVLDHGQRTDVIELLPASMRAVDMLPDNPGTWMFHCHVNDHISAGMATLYEVQPALD